MEKPYLHFAPPYGWMNDPNGLIFFEGEYHLFYQYHPDDIVWGPMHWGHAVSTNLVEWTHLPVALEPDNLGTIFSGSIVAAQTEKSAPPQLTAFFTHHDTRKHEAKTGDHESQSIATSWDNGRTWEKYKGNPVIANPGNTRDFRDPNVFWHEGSKSWIMSLSVGHQAWFYGSTDRKTWTFLSTFEFEDGSDKKTWECVCLFPIKCIKTGNEIWVLIQSQTTDGPQGGSGTQYYIGNFDGKSFKLDPAFETIRRQKGPQWVDYGPDNYAGIIWANAPLPEHQKLFLGWMNNWAYALEVPATTWRGMMTLPRILEIEPWRNTYCLIWSFPESLQPFRHHSSDFDLKVVQTTTLPVSKVTASCGALSVVINGLTSSVIKLELGNSSESVSFRIDPANSTLIVDRSTSHVQNVNATFAAANEPVPVEIVNGQLKLECIFDRYSAEIITGSGETVLTVTYFPESPFEDIRLVYSGHSPIRVTGRATEFNVKS